MPCMHAGKALNLRCNGNLYKFSGLRRKSNLHVNKENSCELQIQFDGEGEGEVAVFSAKRCDRRSS